MFKQNSAFKRIVSISAAAVCMVSAIRFVPFAGEEASAAGEMTAFEITENMEIGWNVGNSLDATSSSSNPGLSSETAWGNPKITRELISAVKAKGFNTIRVPTTWYQHLDSDNNIDQEWLARVKEVVDYAYDQDMYVILNIHHEEWINRSDFADAYDEMSPKLIKIWQQLAAYFADYDQHLIFEGMNEPRAVDTDYEWGWGVPQECYDVINKLNADFIQTVRSVNSPYKDTRLLMIPGYCASHELANISKLVIPEDDKYVAASIHSYSPYEFTMDVNGSHDSFTDAHAAYLDTVFQNIQATFTDKDIPVVIGEFSASNFGNTDARCEWAEYYISCAKEIGIPCVLWDNNVNQNTLNAGEAHGYINRSTLEWYEASEPVVDAMMSVINDSSIVWGSNRKLPVYTHPDIDSGTTLYKDSTGQSLNGAVEGQNCSANYDVTADMLAGKDIAIKFSGDSPTVAGMDSSWNNWTELQSPYDVDEENGIAYYSGDTFLSMWTDAEIAHLCSRALGTTTIYQISIIGEGEIEQSTTQPSTNAEERSVSGTVEILVISDYPEGENYIVIDGVEYKLLSNAIAVLVEKDVKEGDYVSFTGAFKTGSNTLEGVSDLTVSSSEPVWGDADCSGQIEIADAVKIMCYVTDKESTQIDEQGLLNGDVYQTGDGLSVQDALSVQKYLAQIITELPETA